MTKYIQIDYGEYEFDNRTTRSISAAEMVQYQFCKKHYFFDILIKDENSLSGRYITS
jgi:hypothetical protein